METTSCTSVEKNKLGDEKTYAQLVRQSFLEAKAIIGKANNQEFKFIEREVKLSIDVELDTFFRNYLEKFTSIPVYSEESLGSSPLKGKCWIVDPLDGSLNFFRKIPFYTSSIALWNEGQPVMGFVYDYVHDEFYSGQLDSGATLNDRDIKVSLTKKENGVKATGIPSHTQVNESLAMFEKSLESYKKLRWLGCASLSLAYVADGRVDAYEEKGIKLWDVAAGIALVISAGGKASWDFNSDGTLNLRATNNQDLL